MTCKRKVNKYPGKLYLGVESRQTKATLHKVIEVEVDKKKEVSLEILLCTKATKQVISVCTNNANKEGKVL